ncbi:hypothetical protein QQY24_20385 [Streptomyces sp. TG1A-8]|nr:hypothetical protein [Streptomyces sp. TG1A-8]MDO0927651.1 hypothetical protein [Streptomyces sp. TG1A-8]
MTPAPGGTRPSRTTDPGTPAPPARLAGGTGGGAHVFPPARGPRR